MNVMLRGAVGSYAYGLNVPGSDHDVSEVFCYDVEFYLGLGSGKTTFNHKDHNTGEERTRYEVRHWAAQAAKGNPEFLQMLFLDHDHMSEGGGLLYDHRHEFLSKAVYKPYTGCAYRHYKEALEGKNPGKNFMSALRYLRQCTEMLTEGTLHVSRVGRDAEQLKLLRTTPVTNAEMVAMWFDHEKRLKDAYNASRLPYTPNMERLGFVVQNALTLELFEMYTEM